MASEYLVQCQLTEKADVYSYGVLVLEIISGRKNNAFVDDASSLVKTVWQLYKRKKLVDCVHPRLENDFPEIEISSVLQVALLCTQVSVYLRPSMTEVVQMLTEKYCEIPTNLFLFFSPHSNLPPQLDHITLIAMEQVNISKNPSPHLQARVSRVLGI